MSTPHNNADLNDIAKVVLMPGDPLRAKYIAETYLQDVRLINSVRNMYGYTGLYKGVPVSVMASGMGMPSMGIYSYELFKFYNVDCIIRIGSSGSYVESLNLYDIVLSECCWSESTYARAQANVKDHIMFPDQSLNNLIQDVSKKLDIPVQLAKVHSSDVFYHESYVDDFKEFNAKHGCMCVEMESFALFHNANLLNKKAACLLTISDSLVTHEQTTSKQRENSFDKMMLIALESAILI